MPSMRPTKLACKPEPQGEPPDGGWGWVVVIGSNITLQFALFVRCIGVFFNEWRNDFEASATAVSFVLSVHSASFLFMGPLAGYLCNRFGSRKLALIGGLMTSSSIFVSSYATSLLHIILSFGVVGGVGCGFCFVSAVTVISKYFKKRYATANSISNSGSAFTTIILPLLSQFLIDHYSWDGAFFILAALAANMCVCGMLFRPVKPCDKKLSSEGPPQPGLETAEMSVANEEPNGRLRGSRGNVYRKISTSSAGETELGGSEEADVRVKENPAGKPSRRISASRVESGVEGVVQNGSSVGKPQRKVSIYANGEVTLTGVSDGQLIKKLSESGRCSSDGHIKECGRNPEEGLGSSLDVSTSGRQLNGLSAYQGRARMQQRRPTTASIYLGHIARGSGLFLLKTKFRFGLLCIMQSLNNIAIPAVTVHFVPCTIEAGISKQNAAVLMSIFGVGNLFGRLCPGLLIDRKILGPIKMYFLTVLTCGLSLVVCPSLSTFAGYAGFAFVFGFMSGTFKSLPPVLIRKFIGADKLSLGLGILMPFLGIGVVTGPLFVGWLYDIQESYDMAFYITGSILILSPFLTLLLPYLKRLEDRCQPESSTNDSVEEEPGKSSLPRGSIQSLNEI